MRASKKGFSLVEIMIVIVILGVLVAIVVPSYKRYINRSNTADLFTAISMGQDMVAEYLQSNGVTDCSNMAGGNPALDIPIKSPNISSAQILTTPPGPGIASCSLVVIGNTAVFTSDADQYTKIDIPQVQLAALVGGGGGGLNGSNLTPVLYSIPTIAADSSVTWTLYSNGSSVFSTSIPIFTKGGRLGGDGGKGGGLKGSA